MSILSQLTGFLRALRRGERGADKPRHRGHSVGRTAADTLAPREREGNSSTYDHIARGAETYDRSFDD